MLSNNIQVVGNGFYSIDNQNYNYNVGESNNSNSENFDVVLRNTENYYNQNYSNQNYSNNNYLVNSKGVANVPTGISGVSLHNRVNTTTQEVINNPIESLTESDVVISNNVSNYVEVTNKNATQKQHIEDAVKIASNKYNVDENLIKAVIKTESNFNPNAVSSAGAKGLMQVMPANYKSLGISNPFNIYENVDGGTKLLKEYIDKYNGDIEMALMAYNGGPTRMKNRGVTSIDHIYKMPKETQNYVKKVMNYYKGE